VTDGLYFDAHGVGPPGDAHEIAASCCRTPDRSVSRAGEINTSVAGPPTTIQYAIRGADKVPLYQRPVDLFVDKDVVTFITQYPIRGDRDSVVYNRCDASDGVGVGAFFDDYAIPSVVGDLVIHNLITCRVVGDYDSINICVRYLVLPGARYTNVVV
jgi:hypothetical protein